MREVFTLLSLFCFRALFRDAAAIEGLTVYAVFFVKLKCITMVWGE